MSAILDDGLSDVVSAEVEEECPACLRPLKKPRKCKTLFHARVCNRCRNGFANRRQMGYIIDIVVFVFAEYLLITLLRLGIRPMSPSPTTFGGDALLILYTWVLMPFLFTLKDAISGRSPGKLLMGLQVVDMTTLEPIGVGQSIKRNLIFMIPYVGVIAGAITMMRGQRWGERWANTMVMWLKYKHRPPFVPPDRYCRQCGYDLTGNVSGTCPECGEGIRTSHRG